MAQSIFANDNHSHYASYIPITLRMLIAKYLCLLKPFWLRKNNKTSVLLIIIILAMILGVVKIQVWLNDWNNDFSMR
ncbi:ABC transporter ATP-binding protein/permease [Escherichia coli]|nr:ABC transporter ATP-binding protein/permease [Escherichia coli]